MMILEYNFVEGGTQFTGHETEKFKVKGTFTGNGSQGRIQTRESR